MFWKKKTKAEVPKKRAAATHKPSEKSKKGLQTPKILTAEGWRRLMMKGSFKK